MRRLQALIIAIGVAGGGCGSDDPIIATPAPARCQAVLENRVEASPWVQAMTSIHAYAYRAKRDAFDTEVDLIGDDDRVLATLRVRQRYGADDVADGVIEAVLHEGEPDALRLRTSALAPHERGHELRTELATRGQALELRAYMRNAFCFDGGADGRPPCLSDLPLEAPAYTLPSCGLLSDELLLTGIASQLDRLTYVADAPNAPTAGTVIVDGDRIRYALTVMDGEGLASPSDVEQWGREVGVDQILGTENERLLSAAYLDKRWWRARDRHLAECLGEEVRTGGSGLRSASTPGTQRLALSGPQSTDAKIVDWINQTDRTSGGRSNVRGDPHLTSLDGRHWDFQGAGEFVLVEGEDFALQVRTEPALSDPDLPAACGRVTFATALATRVGSTRIAIYARPRWQVIIDGTPIEAPVDVPPLPSGTSLRLERNVAELVWPTRERVSILGAGSSLTISVELPPDRRGKVRGLLGNNNGDESDDLQLRDGTILSAPVAFSLKHGRYADDWRVTSEGSLFDYGPEESTATFTQRNFPDQPARVEDLPLDRVAAAETECREEGVSESAALFDCILDTVCAPGVSWGSEHALQPPPASVEPPGDDLLLRGEVRRAFLPAVLEAEEERTLGVCEAPAQRSIRVLTEQSAIALTSTLATDLDLVAAGPGQMVRSYLVLRHPGPPGFRALEGSIRFGGRILGVYTTTAGLTGSDAAFRPAGTQYALDGEGRGLEPDDALVVDPDGRSLSVEWSGSADVDQIRVVTEVAP